MPKRALVTGISGFAGGFLAEHLLDCGDEVLGSSVDGSWLEGSAPALAGRVELIAWDLSRPDGLAAEARKRIERFRPGVIYHLAALSVPDDCGHDEPTPRAIAVNVEGTGRVVELAASLASPARVLFISSSLVYAPVDPGAARVAEHAPLGPTRGYSKTKQAAEEQVLGACRRGCNAVIARAFQHTGPRQDARMMLPCWARQFAEGDSPSARARPVEVQTLDARMDLTDVRDMVRAYRLLAERGRPGETYNVGSGVEVSSGEVFEVLRTMADTQRPFVQTQPGLRQNPIADNTRLVEATGWQPAIPLEKTIADTLAWWRQRFAARR